VIRVSTVVMATLVILALFGCAVTRPYPVCYFEARPDATQVDAIKTSLEESLRLYVGEYGGISFSPTNRWVTVSTTNRKHTSIEEIWPRLACVGNYTTEDGYVDYRRCLLYIDEVVSSKDYMLAGERNDGDAIVGLLFCDGDL